MPADDTLPRVILHNAVSLDGRIDWLTIDIGLYYRLAGIWQEDATLAGADTICKPDETIPHEDETAFAPIPGEPGDTRPLLVVPDSRGRVRNWHVLRQFPYWRGFVALCSQTTPQEYLAYLRQRHVDYVIAGDDHVDLKAALQMLRARYGIKVVRVDSGGILNGVLLRRGLVDEVSVLMTPNLVGGETPRSLFRAPDLTEAAGVVNLRLMHLEKLQDDVVWLRYEVVK
jgi:2,5-diamino-6-(ribosylamino)-4(3H)-pyrimidinone 5'-phosphate reductase